MANAKLSEAMPTETGIVRVIWRLDSEGSGGINTYPIPQYVQNRYLIIVGVRGSAEISVKTYFDATDVPGIASDFPPTGLIFLSTIGPFSVASGTVITHPVAPYVNHIEPIVANKVGSFACYVIMSGNL